MMMRDAGEGVCFLLLLSRASVSVCVSVCPVCPASARV